MMINILKHQNTDILQILCLPRRQFPASSSPRSMSPAPSDSVSQANSLHRGDSLHARRKDSTASFDTVALRTVSYCLQYLDYFFAWIIFYGSDNVLVFLIFWFFPGFFCSLLNQFLSDWKSLICIIQFSPSNCFRWTGHLFLILIFYSRYDAVKTT